MNTDALRTTDAKSRAKVRDLMTAAVVAIGEAETVQAASVEMHWAHVRHLPVVDGVGRLIGLVTRAELQTALTLYDSAETLPVALVMRRDVFTVGPHTASSRPSRSSTERRGSSASSRSRTSSGASTGS